ncbi:hypothetical protein SAMN05421788_1011049 [Filimonas lacunae]|uniref:DUF4401 domain-containing protein n=1 Tax=Filimonas lacunae TaxID=477680 RepID=A0A173MPP2_9BACT|nr:hypothetical protein [Filimonas lacunae]BAV09614.1 hypothetical protein FLA_5665 [Filimonas lacunae]SIS75944.1 hypothetical protein SAMN05421788_1011049 [Filimonas lacunae]
MQAYNYSDLFNKAVHEQASEAFLDGCLSEESYKNVLAQSPSTLYTPNYFVRVGLSILTIIILLVAFGLGALAFSQFRESALRVLCILAALGGYGVLEMMVKERKLYNAGIDNILMIFILSCIGCAFIETVVSQSIVCFMLTLASAWLCVRFADALMGLVSYACFILFIFLSAVRVLPVFPMVPLILLIVSGVLHLFFKKRTGAGDNVLYSYCYQALIIATAVVMYLSVNFWVVDEWMNGNLFAYGDGANIFVPAWESTLLWVFTFGIPVVYLFNGIRKKDLALTRVGACLLIASVLTFREYFHVMPFEVAAIVAGLFLVLFSSFFIKWLKQPRGGFAFTDADKDRKTLVEAEATILAQAFGKKATHINPNQLFGGGSSGGAGASGNF